MTQFDKRNITMMMDFYEMTMANGYFQDHDKDVQVAFDVFYRANPDDGGFAIFAGLEQVIEYVENMEFSAKDVEYFRQQQMFSEEFLNYLANFHFSGDIYAKNILAENIELGVDAECTVEAVTVGASCNMTTKSKEMEVSANVEYAAEKFTAGAGVVFGTQFDVENSSYLRMNASVESSSIIPGATVSLAYGPNTDGATGAKTTNLLAEKYGSVTAKCTIAF